MNITKTLKLLENAIHQLQKRFLKDPGDYLIEFELDELKARYLVLERAKRLNLKVVYGGRHLTNSETAPERQIS